MTDILSVWERSLQRFSQTFRNHCIHMEGTGVVTFNLPVYLTGSNIPELDFVCFRPPMSRECFIIIYKILKTNKMVMIFPKTNKESPGYLS